MTFPGSPEISRLPTSVETLIWRSEETRGLTCARDDYDEAAAGSQLSKQPQVLAENTGIWHQIRRHGGLSFGLLQTALQLRDLQLQRERGTRKWFIIAPIN